MLLPRHGFLYCTARDETAHTFLHTDCLRSFSVPSPKKPSTGRVKGGREAEEREGQRGGPATQVPQYPSLRNPLAGEGKGRNSRRLSRLEPNVKRKAGNIIFYLHVQNVCLLWLFLGVGFLLFLLLLLLLPLTSL